jgi:excinuclease ABC subunit A
MDVTDDGFVRVRGATEHNLKDVDVDVPRGALVAFTGISGSGKSSLAFGTLYAEAQRRYFESVAPYARRLLQQVAAPHVRDIAGLPPAVALQQRRAATSARSTVGTLTTLSNLLRMLYSRAGSYPRGATRLPAEAFSPNTAAGACPTCHGLGEAHDVTEELMVPDPSLSVREGAIAAWPGAWQGANLRSIVTGLGIDVDTPFRKLKKKDREFLLWSEDQPSVLIEPEPGRVDYGYYGKFWSARKHVMHTLTTSKSQRSRDRALQFVQAMPCRACEGSGLAPQARAVRYAGLTLPQVNELPLDDVLSWAASPSTGDGATLEAARVLTADVTSRVRVLRELGLGYLSLGRHTTTLSPGETQRLRIATQLRSGLFGVVYVLDEPSAGLHPADAEPLLAVLDRLKAAGNSLFVVEHDLDVVRRADWVVDLGPGAGKGGGEVLHSGPVADLEQVKESATSEHLFGRAEVAASQERPPRGWIELRSVRRHNLAGLDVDVPTCVLTAITGVSGSGKSSLLAELEAQSEMLFDRVVRVDQQPIGRTPRSNLATYTGLFDSVRKLFAQTDAAQTRGYGPGRFSFNVAEGRCETCEGEGFVSVELLFLPGTYAPCPSCHGARYNDGTLSIRYDGRSIADVLAMTVDEAYDFLSDLATARRSLDTLRQVGLGYLRLGQPATELSGGEAQRIKLATELQRARRDDSLYLLDEPSSGLHPADVDLLLRQLQRLVDAGSTVVIVEHDMSLVAGSDWVIDLGPGGGAAGGHIVATGRPHEVARCQHSRTAPYLMQWVRKGQPAK